MVTINVIGRLGADAEVVNGTKGQFVSFRMASNEKRVVDGERKEITSWFKVTLNGDRFLKLAEYLKKGSMVCVTGRETVGTFQAKDGTTQISRDISAFNIDFVNAGNGGSEAQTTETTVTTEPVISTGKLAEKPSVEKTSKAAVDDLPF